MRKLWLAFAIVVGVSFLVLGWVGIRIYQEDLAHYDEVFERGRAAYAIPAGTLADASRVRQLTAFFFWTAWAASTERPGDVVTYTSKWPHEPLVGNGPTSEAVVWTGVSIILLLAGIGAMVWHHATRPPQQPLGDIPTVMQTLRWLRVVGDTIFAAGAVALVYFIAGLTTGHSIEPGEVWAPDARQVRLGTEA